MLDFSGAPAHRESMGGDLLPEGTLVAVQIQVNPHNVSNNPPIYDKPGNKNPNRRSLSLTLTVEGGPHNGAKWFEYLTTVNPDGIDDAAAFRAILEVNGAHPQNNPGGYKAADFGVFDGMRALVKTKVEKGTEFQPKGPDGQPFGEKRMGHDKTRVALWISPIATEKAHVDAMQALLAEYGGQLPAPGGAPGAPQAVTAPVPAYATAPMGMNSAPQPTAPAQPGGWPQQGQPQAPQGVQHTAPLPHMQGGWPTGGQQ